jgi:hypothetical protein
LGGQEYHGDILKECSAFAAARPYSPAGVIAARPLLHRAYPQSLTQLVFLIAEGTPDKIANNPCVAQVSGGKVARMKDTVGFVFARWVMVN